MGCIIAAVVYGHFDQTSVGEAMTTVHRQAVEIPNSELVLEFSAPMQVPPGSNILVEASISNNGGRHELIYMPGLSLRRRVEYDRKPGVRLRPDESGLPMRYARQRSSADGGNYVLLASGDFYGRRFRIGVPDQPGIRMGFTVKYENSAKQDSAQWTGRVSLVTGLLPILMPPPPSPSPTTASDGRFRPSQRASPPTSSPTMP